MEVTLVTTGLVCLLAAIVGGGLKGLGFEFPALQSTRRQMLLGAFGAGLILVSQGSKIADYFRSPFPSPAQSQVATQKTPAPPSATKLEQQLSPAPDASLTTSSAKIEEPTSQAAPAYFKPCLAGTRNVIVASGYKNLSVALAGVQSLRSKFPEFRFKLFETVANDGRSNYQYAVVVGHGLNQSEAQTLVNRVRSAEIATDAYHTSQDWDAECSDVSGVER